MNYVPFYVKKKLFFYEKYIAYCSLELIILHLVQQQGI